MSAPAAARPKRGGEEFTRSHYHDDSNASKRLRFDVRNPSAIAPDAVDEEDVVLDADTVGKRGQQVKHNAVNIDGYDSDSSNEGFDARANAKAKSEKKAEKPKDEDQDDMFADVEEEEFNDGDEGDAKDGKRKKKDVRFLNENDIDDYSKGGGHVSARNPTLKADIDVDDADDVSRSSSSESEVGDEARAALNEEQDEELGAGGKKKHAPKLDSFNLRSEQQGGRFDENYNYIRQAVDPDAVHDTWLEGMSKKDMRKAKEAHAKREKESLAKSRQDDARDAEDILGSLISNMELGETVLEALARFGKGREKKKPKWQTKNKRRQESEMDVDVERPQESPEEQKRREAVETITDAADLLLSRGETEIYDADRELLVRRYQKETGEEWEDEEQGEEADDARRWEYRWSDGGEIHGPYDNPSMEAWSSAGYFGPEVEFRRVGDRDAEWSRSLDFSR